MKIIPTTYTFDALNKQIVCSDFTVIEKLAIITNLTAGVMIYQFNNANKGGTIVGTTLTLDYDTTSMADTDELQIIIHDELPKTENGALLVGNAKDKFRDGFTEGFDSAIWDEVWTNQGTGFMAIGGNSAGSGYLNISMCPFTPDMEYTLTSKAMFPMPIRFGYGLSMSQRILADEVQISLVGCDADGVVDEVSTVAPLIMLSGNRFRYVQTVGGTTPSFTRAVNRIIHQFVSLPPYRQIIDRAINVNSLNAVTGTLKTNGAKNVQLVVNMGAITTTAPQFKIQGSDDNGATYYDISTALTAVASSTVQITVNNVNAELIRAIESTAGSGATIGANGLLLKAF